MKKFIKGTILLIIFSLFIFAVVAVINFLINNTNVLSIRFPNVLNMTHYLMKPLLYILIIYIYVTLSFKIPYLVLCLDKRIYLLFNKIKLPHILLNTSFFIASMFISTFIENYLEVSYTPNSVYDIASLINFFSGAILILLPIMLALVLIKSFQKSILTNTELDIHWKDINIPFL